jgi:hypothetical protein
MTTMKDFIPYEQALELKEFGFDEPCFGYYVDGELRGINLGMEELGGIEPYYQRFGFHTLSNHDIDNPNKIVVTAPTFSQAFRWFRENHDLRIWIESNYGVLKFEYVIATSNPNFIDKQFSDFSGYKTYEEAELACLIKLIEIVKTKQQ